jgi:peptidoglycan/LPS O-acetylase OafA/YrhL
VATGHRIRKEIQFLRAVAVILVVLSHTGIPWLHGGFVGVDMFFVISGYVIGLTLTREQLSTGKVSVLHFFQRRFFRIYPPLALMVVGASVYAYFVLPFDKSQDFFIQQARAALFSYSNFFYMYQKVDYFLSNPNLTFFLHTWSLGIEEQFYLLVPVLIYLVSKVLRESGNNSVPKSWNTLFIAIFSVSFLSCIVFLTGRPNWVSGEFQSLMLFYSPLSRAWEFLLGILIAINSYRWIHRCSNFLLFLGMFLVALATVGSPALSFPQFLSSSLAAFGTGLIIYSLVDSNLAESSFFSNKIFTFVGDRSYSIYLWHWIAVAVAEDLFQKIVSREKLALIAVSLIPAFFSYKYVEVPSKKLRLVSKSKKILAAITLVAVPVASLSMLNTLASKSREDYGNVFVQSVLNDCDYWEQVCTIGDDSESDRILLLGDSHAYQLIPIFQSLSSDGDIQVTTCVKICFENEYPSISDNTFQNAKNFDIVVTMFKTNTGTTLRDDRMELSKMISGFTANRNSKLLVVLDNPFFEDFKSPRRVKYPQIVPIPRESQVLSEEVRLDWVEVAGSEVKFFDTFDDLCSESECWVEKNGKVLYVDNNHLSMPGVRLLEPSLIALVAQILDK